MNKTKIKFLSDLPVKVLSKDEVNIGGQTFRRPLIKHYLDYGIPWFCDVLYGEYKGFYACDQDDWKRILKMMDGFGEHMPPETEEPAPFSGRHWDEIEAWTIADAMCIKDLRDFLLTEKR